MITKAKYDKAIDDAFGAHVSAAFNVLHQSIAGASPDSKGVATRRFAETVRVCIEAHEIASIAAADFVVKK